MKKKILNFQISAKYLLNLIAGLCNLSYYKLKIYGLNSKFIGLFSFYMLLFRILPMIIYIKPIPLWLQQGAHSNYSIGSCYSLFMEFVCFYCSYIFTLLVNSFLFILKYLYINISFVFLILFSNKISPSFQAHASHESSC